MIEFISQPWQWYVAGPIISAIMFFLIYFGKNFGMSANLRTMCTIGGAGKLSDFFNFDWKNQLWNLIFVAGTITGGFIASNYLNSNQAMDIAPSIIKELQELGVKDVGQEILPSSLFSFEALFSLRGIIMLIGGGFLVGFGAIYAGGCTS